MSVNSTKQRQAKRTINSAATASQAISKPLDGWISAFQTAIGMSQTCLAGRLGIARNSLYRSLENERAGTISLNQLAKVADAMGGRIVYAIVPKEGPVEDIIMTQAHKKAKHIIQRTRAHMALEEQTDGLRSQKEMIEDLATEMMREMPREFWK